MKMKRHDVVRWLIWFQTGVLILVSIGSLADRERISKTFCPPEWLMVFCAFAMWITPMVVIATWAGVKLEQQKWWHPVISILIAITSVWAFLPIIQ